MLREKINHYVRMQRAMGFKYRAQDGLLQHFIVFAEARGDTCVRSQTVLEWAGLAPSPAQRTNRLLTVRRFAIAMQSEDGQYKVPPADAFGRQYTKRKIRHIYSPEDINQLLHAASELEPADSIKPKTYTTLFALLAATGLRASEALALNTDDITDDGLTVKATKFSKDRLVLLHESALQGIQRYLADRTRFTSSIDSALFISNKGTRLPYNTVSHQFLELMRSIGLRGAPGTLGPRIHDLRHTFAVKSLEQCAGDQGAVSRHMLALSTYLGHAHISDTYWYLQATPVLLTKISVAQEACYKEMCDD